jgi:hypothetical protein
MLLFAIIFITTHNVAALSSSDMPSSTPENVGTGQYQYVDNTSQLQFIIPVIVAIISIVVVIAIYAGTRSIKK